MEGTKSEKRVLTKKTLQRKGAGDTKSSKTGAGSRLSQTVTQAPGASYERVFSSGATWESSPG